MEAGRCTESALDEAFEAGEGVIPLSRNLDQMAPDRIEPPGLQLPHALATALGALDQPRALYALQQRVDPSNKSTDALQELLMRMRTAGKVKFDIKTGKWSKA